MSMPRRKGREPRVDIRRHHGKDGVVREYPGVRFYDADGVCRRVTYTSIAEAEFERARMVLAGEVERPGHPDGSTTLEAFWQVWLPDAKGRLAEGTIYDYEYLWQRRVRPRFGELPMREITPRAVSQWKASMSAEGIGRETIRKSMMLLQAVLTVAIEWGEATDNAVSLVRKPRQGRQRAIEVIKPKDVERMRLLTTTKGDLLSKTLIVVLAYSGLRPAEALGLELRHIREDTLLVEQAVSRGKLKLQKTGRVYRTVDLLDALRDDLDEWVARQSITESHALLFPREDGEPWRKDDYDNWRNRRFRKYARDISFGTSRPYDLRHSFASLLIREQRASIVDIADQMGHSPTETLKDYAHVMRDYRRKKPVRAGKLIAKARRAAQEEHRRPVPVGDNGPEIERDGGEAFVRVD
jgi:integrase